MQNTSQTTRNAETKTNVARLHRVLDTKHSIVKLDFQFLYQGEWYQEENGEEFLVLEAENDSIKFSKDAIEQGKIHENSITMTTEDTRRCFLEFFTTERVRL